MNSYNSATVHMAVLITLYLCTRQPTPTKGKYLVIVGVAIGVVVCNVEIYLKDGGLFDSLTTVQHPEERDSRAR